MTKFMSGFKVKFPIFWRIINSTIKTRSFQIVSAIYFLTFLTINFTIFGLSMKSGYGMNLDFTIFASANYTLSSAYFLYLNLFLITKYYAQDIQYKIMILEKRKGLSLFRIFIERYLTFKIISTAIFSMILILFGLGAMFPMPELNNLFYRNFIIGFFAIYLFDLFIAFIILIFATYSKTIVLSVISTLIWVMLIMVPWINTLSVSFDGQMQPDLEKLNAINMSHNVAKVVRNEESKNKYVEQILNDYKIFDERNESNADTNYRLLQNGILGDYLNNIEIYNESISIEKSNLIRETKLGNHIIRANNIHENIDYTAENVIETFNRTPFDNRTRSNYFDVWTTYEDKNTFGYESFIKKFKKETTSVDELNLINIVDKVVRFLGPARLYNPIKELSLFQDHYGQINFEIFNIVNTNEVEPWTLQVKSSLGERIYTSTLNSVIDWSVNIRNLHQDKGGQISNIEDSITKIKELTMFSPFIHVENILFSNYHKFEYIDIANLLLASSVEWIKYPYLPHSYYDISVTDPNTSVERNKNPFSESNYISVGERVKIYDSSLAIFLIWFIFTILNVMLFFEFRLKFKKM